VTAAYEENPTLVFRRADIALERGKKVQQVK
jgi:hypothetical protein